MYSVGQFVIAKNMFSCDEGIITEIKDNSYHIGNHWYFDNEIVKTIKSAKNTPNYYYNSIRQLEQKEEDEIYNLVKSYGSKKDIDCFKIEYSLKLKKNWCFVNTNDGERVCIDKIVLIDSPLYQCRGYIFLFDTNNKQYSFETSLTHQQFNVHSALYHTILEKKI